MTTGTSVRTVVVVGASVAGVRTVQALRAEGFDGVVVLVGAEPHLPYDKPPLSKRVLLQDLDETAIPLCTEAELTSLDVELRLGTAAVSLSPGSRHVRLADGEVLRYDDLVLATGASARPSPWQVRSGVHLLRTWTDAVALRERLAAGSPLVVVGGGLIGSEVAAAARARGCAVTIVDPLALPMARLAGRLIAERYHLLHRDHGVRTHYGVAVRSVRGEADQLRVELSDGSVLETATVVVGIGSVPNDAWLAESGIPLDGGVVCDGHLGVAGVPRVHAVGDVARWPHPRHRRRVRAEHWTNAVDQGRYVGRTIAGTQDSERYVPSDYVWTDQYDWKLQTIGHVGPDTRSDVIGSLECERPVAAVVHAAPDGSATGGAAVNWPRALLTMRRLIDRCRPASEVVDAVHGL